MTGQGLLNDLLKIADKSSSDTGVGSYRELGLVWLDYIIKDIQNRQQNFHWRFLENTTQISLVVDDFDYALTTIASDIDTTKVITIYDKINNRTYRYVDYKTFRMFVADETNQTGDSRIFTIFGGNLLLWPVPNFTAITGTTDGSTTANKLIDSTATFTTDGIKVGMRVTNTTDTTYALVTAVDSDTQLTLDTDIMATGEAYSIAEAVHMDYVKVLIDAVDTATALLIPDKYKMVVMDGLLTWVFKFDKELGNPTTQQQIYELGIDRMIRDNGQIIAENLRPISHRVKHHVRDNVDGKNSLFFPLAGTNF